jgi:hypothetical protein
MFQCNGVMPFVCQRKRKSYKTGNENTLMTGSLVTLSLTDITTKS